MEGTETKLSVACRTSYCRAIEPLLCEGLVMRRGRAELDGRLESVRLIRDLQADRDHRFSGAIAS